MLAHRAARAASPRYLADLRERLRVFSNAFQVPVSSVTSADIQRWLDARKPRRKR